MLKNYIFQHGVVFHAEQVRDARVGLVPNISGKANKSILATCVFQLPISSDKNIRSIFQAIYLPHHKLHTRIFFSHK